MAKSPLGRVEMLADHFGAGKEMIMGASLVKTVPMITHGSMLNTTTIK